jgi:hypothetical protein
LTSRAQPKKPARGWPREARQAAVTRLPRGVRGFSDFGEEFAPAGTVRRGYGLVGEWSGRARRADRSRPLVGRLAGRGTRPGGAARPGGHAGAGRGRWGEGGRAVPPPRPIHRPRRPPGADGGEGAGAASGPTSRGPRRRTAGRQLAAPKLAWPTTPARGRQPRPALRAARRAPRSKSACFTGPAAAPAGRRPGGAIRPGRWDTGLCPAVAAARSSAAHRPRVAGTRIGNESGAWLVLSVAVGAPGSYRAPDTRPGGLG